MPTVVFEPVRDLNDYAKYVLKDRGVEIHTSAPEGLNDEMETIIHGEFERMNNKRAKHEAFTIYQNWHPKESKLYSPEQFNEMGRMLADKWAPGHLAWVTTHTDKGHVHNHITFCGVHSETGKVLKRDDPDMERLHSINNAIAKEHSLMLNVSKFKDPNANLPAELQVKFGHGKQSWARDLGQKLDFARASSTSFDEYVGQLDMLGIEARVEKKNISYVYPGHKHPHRGKKLGPAYDKEGLMKTFKENDERFAKTPGLRDQLRTDIRAVFDGKGNPVGTPSDLLLESTSDSRFRNKDYGKFRKVSRRSNDYEPPSDFGEHYGPLYSEMKKARAVSIFDYCEKHKIPLTKNAKGETVVKGKEFVVVTASTYTNTKSRTGGSVIGFAAIHVESDYIGGIAKITGNNRILALRQYMGEYSSKWQSFYMPKPPRSPEAQATKTMLRFLDSKGIKGNFRESLLKNQAFHAGNDGSVWLMGKSGDSASEFREKSNGNWEQKRHGKPSGTFLERSAKGKNVMLFRDPFSFLEAEHKGHVKKDAATIVLFSEEHSHRPILEFLSSNPHVKEVQVFTAPDEKDTILNGKLFQDLKRDVNPFEIQIRGVDFVGHDKSRGRGPDIGF